MSKQNEVPNNKFALRIYSAIVNLYPETYRREFGASMTQTFMDYYRDTYAEYSKVGARFWAEIVLDETKAIIREHSEAMNKQNISEALSTVTASVGLGVAVAIMSLLKIPHFLIIDVFLGIILGIGIGWLTKPQSSLRRNGAIYGVTVSISYWFILGHVNFMGANFGSVAFTVVLLSGLGALSGLLLATVGMKVHQLVTARQA